MRKAMQACLIDLCDAPKQELQGSCIGLICSIRAQPRGWERQGGDSSTLLTWAHSLGFMLSKKMGVMTATHCRGGDWIYCSRFTASSCIVCGLSIWADTCTRLCLSKFEGVGDPFDTDLPVGDMTGALYNVQCASYQSCV